MSHPETGAHDQPAQPVVLPAIPAAGHLEQPTPGAIAPAGGVQTVVPGEAIAINFLEPAPVEGTPVNPYGPPTATQLLHPVAPAAE